MLELVKTVVKDEPMARSRDDFTAGLYSVTTELRLLVRSRTCLVSSLAFLPRLLKSEAKARIKTRPMIPPIAILKIGEPSGPEDFLRTGLTGRFDFEI